MGIEAEKTRPTTLRSLIAYLADEPVSVDPVNGVTYSLFSGDGLWEFGQTADGIIVSANGNNIINISLREDKDRPLTELESKAVNRLIDGLTAKGLPENGSSSFVKLSSDSGLGSILHTYGEEAKFCATIVEKSYAHSQRMDDFLARDHGAELMALVEKLEYKDQVAKYFSYKDLLDGSKILMPTRIKLTDNMNRVEKCKLTKSELLYAKTISEYLTNDWSRSKAKILDALADKIRLELQKRMAALRLPLSPYSESLSWAYWDIAKQLHLSNHPEESTPEYRLGNPLHDPRVVEEIISRHLGWELHQKWRIPEARLSIEGAIAHNPQKQHIEDLLNKDGKPDNRTLSSHELTLLGKLLSAS
ncbi:MAG: hypothetical protein AAB383_05935 [Patescibacteria group bacterium]